jgi:hypothetical protein
MAAKKSSVYKSAVSGKIVKKAYADSHPKTTFKETTHPKKKTK